MYALVNSLRLVTQLYYYEGSVPAGVMRGSIIMAEKIVQGPDDGLELQLESGLLLFVLLEGAGGVGDDSVVSVLVLGEHGDEAARRVVTLAVARVKGREGSGKVTTGRVRSASLMAKKARRALGGRGPAFQA